MPHGPQVRFMPLTYPTPSPTSQGAAPLPFEVQLSWQALEAPSQLPPHPRGPGGVGIEVIPNTLPWSGVLLVAVLPPASESTFFLPRIPWSSPGS